MNENNKASKLLSDHALERVMRDVLSGIWEISSEKAQQELAKTDPPQNGGGDDSEAER